VPARAYRVLLHPAGATRLLLTALLGRLPVGIFSLAIVLVVREQTGSFAEAGVASAAFAIGAGAVAPLQGRLVDRLGQPAVLLPSALLNAAAMAALVLAGDADAPGWTVIALAAVGGAAIPPLSACMRSQWASLFAGDDGARGTAYSLESVFNELIFIVGPLLTTLLVAIASPSAALLIAAGVSLVGTLGFATARLARGWEGEPADRTRAGALASPGMRTLVLAVIPTGMAFGVLEVAMPAYAVDQGRRPAIAGILLAAMAVGSVLGGLWSAAREWRLEVVVRFLVLHGAFAAGMLPLLLADSLATMALAMLVAGLALAPSAAAGYLLIDRMAPPGTATEAYTWAVTASITGTALGAALAGIVVQHASVRWAILLAFAGPALGTLISLLRRATFAPVVVAGAASERATA
jgi:MFS family permease